jgi:hypothetical protein
MPSPFPGMDPYLEDPGIWPDVHDALAGEIRRTLNKDLPSNYYAQLGVREEIGIIGEGVSRRMVPDVIVQSASPIREGGVAVLAEPRVEVDPYVEIEVVNEFQEVNSVEIRDASRDHEVVTIIEILGPTNKRRGPDRELYWKKREEVLASETSLVEIDLLRHGDRSFYGPTIYGRLVEFDPPADYLLLVNRSWKRGLQTSFQLFPSYVRNPLPVISIPLREGEVETTLDVQYVFSRAYDSGPYRRGAVDYSSDLDGPNDFVTWARERVRAERKP